MSDLENENPPENKRTRLSKHSRQFQPLSLPLVQDVVQSRRRRCVKSQNYIADENINDDNFRDSVGGVIKTIKLINFMCHSHFEISFNPNINFIIGANGSGKSAIQTALAIGLGGTASRTNRSSKIEGLIKHGCRAGSVSITLSNINNAYESEKFGKEITIVRNINGSSSNYKIYSQSGHLMSSKKCDLDKILLNFKIQPNNPVSILNQDMSRNFLSANRPEIKYVLFKQATQLDEAETLLLSIRDELADQDRQLEHKGKAVQHIEEEISKLSQKVELIKKLKYQKEKVFQLEAEFLWSHVNTHRDELIKLQEIYDEQENIKQEVENNALAVENEISEKKAKLDDLQHSMEILQNESKSKEEILNKLKDEFRQKKKFYEDKCMKYEDIARQIRMKESDRVHLQKSLDDIEKAEEEQKQKKTEAVLEINNSKDNLTDFEGEMKILEHEITRFKNTSDHFQQQANEKRNYINELQKEISYAESNVQKAVGQSDNLSAYDSYMPLLVMKIDEAVKQNKFSKPPRGPLGRYIKVKKDEWTYAIENNISVGVLKSFFVNNANDRSILYQIMKQVIPSGNKPTVHCSRFQDQARISIQETRHSRYENMFRTLSISDHAVANFLMDYRDIQKVLLVKSNEECVSFFERGDKLPDKCNLLLNINGDQYLPGFRVYSNMDSRLKQVRVLQKNVVDYLRNLKESIIEKKNMIESEKQEYIVCKEQHQNNASKAQQTINQLKDIKMNIGKLARRIKELKNIVDTETPSLQEQINELTEIENEIINLKAAKKKIEIERDEGANNLRNVKKQMETCGGIDTFNQQTVFANDVEKLTTEINRLQIKVESFSKKLQEQAMKMNKLKSRMEEITSKLDSQKDNASQLSAEPDLQQHRSTQEIKDEMATVKTFIAEAEKSLGSDIVSYEKNYWEELKSCKNLKKSYQESQRLHNMLKKRHKDRRESFEGLRIMKSNAVFAQFQKVLQTRNYKGQLKFDHDRSKLDILLAPTDGGDSYMNTESLSGGEKSFSTVGFLMALWSTMELPFYSMDEYDVFMDALNRNAITELLMAFGRDKSNKQFIFLTPLDTSIIKPGPHVQLHRIKKLQS